MIRTNYPNPTRSAAATPVRPVSTTGQTGPTCHGHTTGQTGSFDRSDRSYRTKPQLSYRTLVQLPNLI